MFHITCYMHKYLVIFENNLFLLNKWAIQQSAAVDRITNVTKIDLLESSKQNLSKEYLYFLQNYLVLVNFRRGEKKIKFFKSEHCLLLAYELLYLANLEDNILCFEQRGKFLYLAMKIIFRYLYK